MPRPTKAKQEMNELKNQLRVPELINVKEDIAEVFDKWLDATIKEAIAKRDERAPRVRKWRRTISGERAVPPVRAGASNISVPLTMWVRVAVRARLTESILHGGRRLLSVLPVPGRREPEDETSSMSISTSMVKLLSAEISNSQGLDGKTAIERTAVEFVDFGGGALKVVPVRDDIRKVRDTKYPIPGGVKWEHISLEDLIYCDGYGTDTQKMPLIGHQYEETWGQLNHWATLGYYDKKAVEEVEAFMSANRKDEPPALRPHDIAELYLDYDIDGDGIQESLLVTWHMGASKRLRVIWNPFPMGKRPILLGQFDVPANATDAIGQGVCEKLEGPQDEVDAIHNIGIEAGKRGAAFLTVMKADTRAEEEFGGDEDITPGDKLVTENPAEDILAVPLGDSRAGIAAISLEEHTRVYVTRIFGLDEAKLGNVESAKRVSASVGMATMQEGRLIIRAAMSSLGAMLTEAAYLTLELWRDRLPEEALLSTLTEAEAEAFRSAVVTVSDVSLRNQYIIRFNSQDAASSNEEKKNELIAINQFLFGFYDRMQQFTMVLSDPNLPPDARKPLLLIVDRMERGIEALLQTLDSIPNPEELLVRVGALKDLLSESSQAVAPFEEQTDLGAGVS